MANLRATWRIARAVLSGLTHRDLAGAKSSLLAEVQRERLDADAALLGIGDLCDCGAGYGERHLLDCRSRRSNRDA